MNLFNLLNLLKTYFTYWLTRLILFTCSFNSVTLSLGIEGEPFGARKQYAMTIGHWVRICWSAPMAKHFEYWLTYLIFCSFPCFFSYFFICDQIQLTVPIILWSIIVHLPKRSSCSYNYITYYFSGEIEFVEKTELIDWTFNSRYFRKLLIAKM